MMIQRTQCFKGVMAAVATAALMSISSAQGRPRDVRAFNTTMEGRGSVHVNGATYSFNQLQVTVQNNDRLTVHALLYTGNQKDVVLTGKLRDDSWRSNRIRADITSVSYGRDFDSADATCSIVTDSDDRFSTVTIEGRNTSDRNNVSLDFTSNGRKVRDYQYGDRPGNGRRDDRDWDDRDDRRRSASGKYTDSDEWRRRDEHFLVRYHLDLDRNGKATMTVKSEEDRNMPDDRNARYGHGNILQYLQRGRDVVQTGRWTQDGNDITITFDRMEVGRDTRSHRETLKGKLRNGSIWIDRYSEDLYGHRVEMSFEKKRIFG